MRLRKKDVEDSEGHILQFNRVDNLCPFFRSNTS